MHLLPVYTLAAFICSSCIPFLFMLAGFRNLQTIDEREKNIFINIRFSLQYTAIHLVSSPALHISPDPISLSADLG